MFEGLIITLNTLIIMAISIERSTEIVKKFYLPIKDKYTKTTHTELSVTDKQAISLVIGIFLCTSLGVGVDIPNIQESLLTQQLIASIVASTGSNVLHSILGVLIAFKDSFNDVKK